MLRRPAVAGTFYPGEPGALVETLDRLFGERRPSGEERGIALMVPHAGYIYSGKVAAATFAAARLARRVVLLGPNHTGQGQPIALLDEGSWGSPLGEIPIDGALASDILTRCREARVDDRAHRREHSLEVQVPFLQRLIPDLRLVPICVGTMRLESLLDLGRGLAEAIGALEEDALLVLSSDMSHYVPAMVAEHLDRLAIDRLLEIDPVGLHRTVMSKGISMCSVAPAVAGLEAARRLGARRARLVAYTHSGETSGDYDAVVGYAGVTIS